MRNLIVLFVVLVSGVRLYADPPAVYDPQAVILPTVEWKLWAKLDYSMSNATLFLDRPGYDRLSCVYTNYDVIKNGVDITGSPTAMFDAESDWWNASTGSGTWATDPSDGKWILQGAAYAHKLTLYLLDFKNNQYVDMLPDSVSNLFYSNHPHGREKDLYFYPSPTQDSLPPNIVIYAHVLPEPTMLGFLPLMFLLLKRNRVHL